MKPLVVYHDKCTDGYGAAFAAWMKFGDDAEYVACSYGQDKPLPVCEGREVYVLDFSFDREFTNLLCDYAKKFVWLDHHKTAFEMWVGGSIARHEEIHDAGHYILLDNDKSGALLAWEYFHPNVPVPPLISYIDDRDRWVFQYDASKAVHAGLAAAQPWSFEQWQAFLDPSACRDQLAVPGAAILGAQDSNVSRMAAQTMPVKITAGEIYATAQNTPAVAKGYEMGGYIKGYEIDATGLAVNASIHQSELGHVVATKSGTYALVWYLATDGRANCSLRSNGDYDVSAIAKAFGGGGHRNAAGFQVDIDTLLGWLK